ncbi:Uncharacterised protein [Mycobacteroides abscessus subsp. abscessus]|nr:Uncharacterised protein [Mycobacteroides abscessus subsp. abscessus]
MSCAAVATTSCAALATVSTGLLEPSSPAASTASSTVCSTTAPASSDPVFASSSDGIGLLCTASHSRYSLPHASIGVRASSCKQSRHPKIRTDTV